MIAIVAVAGNRAPALLAPWLAARSGTMDVDAPYAAEHQGVRFSVVIPTLHRPVRLGRTLENLASARPPPNEIIVVDGDPDRSGQAIVNRMRDRLGDIALRYVASETGTSRQRNVGLALATGDVVAFLDDDVEIETAAFKLLAGVYAEPTIVGATARVVETGGRRIGGMHSPLRRLLFGGRREGMFTRFGYPRRLVDTDTARDVELMYGCFMTARTDQARDVGFDEELTGYGIAEDEDFAYRLSKKGRIRYVPRILVTHDNLGFRSMDRRRFSRAVVVTRAYLFRKNFPQTALAKLGFSALIVVLLAHRLLNRDLSGAAGVLEGAVEVYTRR